MAAGKSHNKPQEASDALQEQVRVGGGIPGLPDWAFNCYKAHAHRGQSITSLANAQGVAWATMRNHIDKVHALVLAVENSDVLTACDKYIAGLRETLSCLWRDYSAATNDAVKCGLLKAIAQVLEQIAAAEGVVTQRKGEEHSGHVTVSWWDKVKAAQDGNPDTDGATS